MILDLRGEVMSKIFRQITIALAVAGIMLTPARAYATDSGTLGLSIETTDPATESDSSSESSAEESSGVSSISEAAQKAASALEEMAASEASSGDEIVPYSSVESVDEAMNGVVQVNCVFDDDDGDKHIICGGAGFLIGTVDGSEYVITNNHIVSPEYSVRKAAYKYYKFPNTDNNWKETEPYVEVVLENDITAQATIVNASETLDFVVLSLSQPLYNRTPLTVLVADEGSKEKPYATTDSVYGLGFPEGITHDNVQFFDNKQVTMSSGKIASYTDYNGADLIQHNAQVSTNNCGGPLLNENGLVIGMNELSTDSNNYYSLDASDIAKILNGLGIEYYSMTTSEYETWLHRNDPEPDPVDPTPIPVPEPDPVPVPFIPVWIIAILIILGVLVLGLIVVFIVVLLKQKKIANANNPEAQKKPVKEKKPNPSREMPQMRPLTPIPNPSGSMETGVMGENQSAGQTTVLNPSTPPEAGEPLITSGTLIRRKNSDNIIIDKQSFSIGKDSLHVDYCITDNPAVSRTHATINTVNNQVFLQDCHSTNGTFINNRKLADGSSEPIKNGDIIKIADEEFQYRI